MSAVIPSFRRTPHRMVRFVNLAEPYKLDIKVEHRVGGNDGTGTLLTVAKGGGDDELAPPTGLHALHAEVPSFDDRIGVVPVARRTKVSGRKMSKRRATSQQ